MVRAPPRTTTKGAGQKVLLVDGREYLGDAFLQGPVRYTRYAQWALFLLTGLRDIHSPNVRRWISLAVNRLKHIFNPDPELSFASATVCPSTPGAELVGI